MNDHSPFAAISTSRTANEIIFQVEELILDGVLRSGDRLPSERDLAAQLNVSRPILREAIKELEARGLLISKHGGGTFIADIVGEIFSEPLSALITRHARAIRDYLEYRRHIEGLTAELAAQRASETDKAILTDIINKMRRAHDNGLFEDELKLDVEFHNAIGEAAHNIVLMHSLRSCYRLLTDDIFYNRHLIFSLDNAHADVMKQHEGIYKAIINQDAALARHQSEMHIDFIAAATNTAQQQLQRDQIAQLRLRQRKEQHDH